MKTPIAEMILEMHGKGIPVELIASAVARLEEAMAARAVSTGQDTRPADTSMMEKRRAWDRERKRKQRSLKLPDSQWWSLIGAVLQRDGRRCTYCESTEQLTADHVVPLTRGGTNDLSNLTACCIPCNTKKGNKFLSEWSGGQSAKFHPTVHRNPVENPCILVVEKKEEAFEEEVKGKKESKKVTTRGTRIPPDFSIDDADRAFAASLGLPPEVVEGETPAFIDYWSGVPASKGLKLDWKATWRNRMRDLKKYRSQGVRSNSPVRTDPAAGRATTREAQLVAAVGRGAANRLAERTAAGPDRPAPGSTGSAEVFDFGKRAESAR